MNTSRLAALCALSLLACINGDRRLYEVELTGELVAPAGVTGAAVIEFHHAESGGPGALTRPLGPIDRVRVPAVGSVRHTVLVPTEEGRGLVVYAWVDVNGDGQLCAPGTAPEPAGLAVVSGFPAHALSYRLELRATCVGPEALFPTR